MTLCAEHTATTFLLLVRESACYVHLGRFRQELVQRETDVVVSEEMFPAVLRGQDRSAGGEPCWVSSFVIKKCCELLHQWLVGRSHLVGEEPEDTMETWSFPGGGLVQSLLERFQRDLDSVLPDRSRVSAASSRV